MTDKQELKPAKGVYLRDKIWWFTFTSGRKRYRRSLGTNDLEVANIRSESIKSYVNSKNYRDYRLPSILPTDWGMMVSTATQTKSDWLFKIYVNAKNRARNNDMEFSLSFSELQGIASRCGGRCEVTGVPLTVGRDGDSRAEPFIPSLDRINSCRGYTKQNCRMVAYITNLAMSNWGDGPLKTLVHYCAPNQF